MVTVSSAFIPFPVLSISHILLQVEVLIEALYLLTKVKM
ncbi:hypothetical protein SPAR55_1991 [Streptococcus pneumoniae SPAR55]|nr:hypothetical protein SPAR93_2072 [Streptococcus pneumoniae GA47368]EHD61959.1 hypothetical protein SPAR70_0144 [Streptococcus pneumoniae GA41410]EHE13530.1 hypothetical protein SPAR56_2216 [Streptococcus pneumoniae GA19077]EHE46140.1 hypothetical protein SPAR115_1980 [Streptococcus pneumoniae GA52306]EHZ50599.1 hypothetical protein SPAR83_2013 [Streptococcus pneumoniae GA44386]EJG84077.1 hypothetical protein SPAR55_1991 [Streptococcus pneumoniae SPAR55]EJH18965.1 hypothetical protein SPAR1